MFSHGRNPIEVKQRRNIRIDFNSLTIILLSDRFRLKKRVKRDRERITTAAAAATTTITILRLNWRQKMKTTIDSDE
ncbi:hypothetical protein RUM44_007849 [Polyplax serrata]|uniref:Uncharacterized protein n=1 Tax=Polyplax serrata TaxID=468196 RepID=A0ABR1BAM9_POLSC